MNWDWWIRLGAYTSFVIAASTIVLVIIGVGGSTLYRYLRWRWRVYRWWRSYERERGDRGICVFHQTISRKRSQYRTCVLDYDHGGPHTDEYGPILTKIHRKLPSAWREYDGDFS